MNMKIKKIDAEYEKNAAKISELQARQKELDKQRAEFENLDIIGLVRSLGMTADELAALIQSAKTVPALTTAPITHIEEDTDHEDI